MDSETAQIAHLGYLGDTGQIGPGKRGLSIDSRYHECQHPLLVQLEASKLLDLSVQIIKMVSLEKGPSDFRPASVYERADYQILNSELEGW